MAIGSPSQIGSPTLVVSSRLKPYDRGLRFGRVLLVTIGAVACGLYFVYTLTPKSPHETDILMQLHSLASKPGSSQTPIVTVKAFVPPKGLASRNIPTVLASIRAPNAPTVKANFNAGLKASSKLSKIESLDEKNEHISSSPALSTQSMDELYREVEDLEKQEKIAMATRAKALAKAMATTNECDAGKNPCAQAHLDVKWKSAKDKYEQAAFNDVMQEEKQRNTTTEEGESEFQKISELADNLSGLKELNQLNNQSAAAVSARAKQQRQTMTLLRKETRALEAVKKQEAILRAQRAQQRQREVEAKMRAQAEDDLKAMSYTAEERQRNKAESLREARAAQATGSAGSNNEATAQSDASPAASTTDDAIVEGTAEYTQDVHSAEQTERLRQAAWERSVQAERETPVAPASAQRLHSAAPASHRKEDAAPASSVPPAAAQAAGDDQPSSAYHSDLSRAAAVEQQRQEYLEKRIAVLRRKDHPAAVAVPAPAPAPAAGQAATADGPSEEYQSDVSSAAVVERRRQRAEQAELARQRRVDEEAAAARHATLVKEEAEHSQRRHQLLTADHHPLVAATSKGAEPKVAPAARDAPSAPYATDVSAAESVEAKRQSALEAEIAREKRVDAAARAARAAASRAEAERSLARKQRVAAAEASARAHPQPHAVVVAAAAPVDPNRPAGRYAADLSSAAAVEERRHSTMEQQILRQRREDAEAGAEAQARAEEEVKRTLEQNQAAAGYGPTAHAAVVAAASPSRYQRDVAEADQEDRARQQVLEAGIAKRRAASAAEAARLQTAAERETEDALQRDDEAVGFALSTAASAPAAAAAAAAEPAHSAPTALSPAQQAAASMEADIARQRQADAAVAARLQAAAERREEENLEANQDAAGFGSSHPAAEAAAPVAAAPVAAAVAVAADVDAETAKESALEAEYASSAAAIVGGDDSDGNGPAAGPAQAAMASSTTYDVVLGDARRVESQRQARLQSAIARDREARHAEAARLQAAADAAAARALERDQLAAGYALSPEARAATPRDDAAEASARARRRAAAAAAAAAAPQDPADVSGFIVPPSP